MCPSRPVWTRCCAVCSSSTEIPWQPKKLSSEPSEPRRRVPAAWLMPNREVGEGTNLPKNLLDGESDRSLSVELLLLAGEEKGLDLVTC